MKKRVIQFVWDDKTKLRLNKKEKKIYIHEEEEKKSYIDNDSYWD